MSRIQWKKNWFLGFCMVVTGTLLSLAGVGAAQGPPGMDQPDLTITAVERQKVIEGVIREVSAGYVFPESAKKMAADLSKRLAGNEYDGIASAVALATTLTEQLQALSHDKHLRVRYSFETLPRMGQRGPGPEDRARMRKEIQTQNFGFEKVERLKGNVGYIDLHGFMPPEEAGETAAAAMSFLGHTRALIIDLRKNGGGSPEMVALLSTYLFGTEPVHLNDLYFRPDNTTRQFWTLPYVNGPRFEGKDVFVLTSKRTFSAAEEFTYNLKNLKRATIIGETTGGGAHPGGSRRLHDHFSVFVPSGRAINPISKTNWEGTGVKPDVEVPAARALTTAHLSALKKLSARNSQDPLRDEWQRTIKELESLLEEQQKAEK
jgi:hypothetical protein